MFATSSPRAERELEKLRHDVKLLKRKHRGDLYEERQRVISVTEVLERERLMEGRAVRAERERRQQVAKELEKVKRTLGKARSKIAALERAAEQSTESVRKELVQMRKEVKKLRRANEKQAIKVLASAHNDGMGINGRVQEALRNLPPGLAKVRRFRLAVVCV